MSQIPLAGRALLLLAALAAPAVEAQNTARLDSLVSAASAAGAFDGVVLVGQRGATVYARAAGVADRAWNVPVALDTRFPFASVTKQLTAVAVLQLVGEGKLALDTRLGDVLPGLRADAAGRVPIRTLLTNSSGLPNPDDIAGFYTADDSTAAALMDAALAEDLAFEPGSTFRYTNTDFIALGRVVAALDGRPFAEALRTRVLVPAGMTETVLLDDSRVEPRLAAASVALSGGAFGPAPPTRLATFGAAGAAAGTAADLLRFDAALLDGRLLPPALRDSMFTADAALGFVALSVWTYTMQVEGRAVRLVERQGWIGGYRALNLLAPDDGLALVVLANTDAADLSQTYTGRGFSASLVRAALSSE